MPSEVTEKNLIIHPLNEAGVINPNVVIYPITKVENVLDGDAPVSFEYPIEAQASDPIKVTRSSSTKKTAIRLDKATLINLIKDDIAPVIRTDILEMVFPVGSIYTSTDAEVTDPAEVLGFGTWQAIYGRFLVATTTVQDPGQTGGSTTITIPTNALPRHNHNVTLSGGSHRHTVYAPINEDTGTTDTYVLVSRKAKESTTWFTNTSEHTHTGTTNNAGNGAPFTHLPPYLTVKMWERIE